MDQSGLECANCGANKDVLVVCHHCGKPLCHDLQNCRFEIEDDVFSSRVIAVHCRECWQTFHPNSRPRK